MEQVVPWRKLCALGSRIIPSQGTGVQRWEWSACYALIVAAVVQQVDGALEGGAPVCGDEAEVRICEATLPMTEEKCHPAVRGVRARESVLAEEKTLAPGAGLSPAAQLRRSRASAEPVGDRKHRLRMLVMAD